MNAALSLAPVAVAGALLLWAGASDLARYRIPNLASLGLLGAFGLFVVTDAGSAMDLPSHLIVGGVMLALGIAAFVRNLAGGGDGKLLAAVALWAGPAQLLPVLLVTALLGGALALAQVLTVQQARARAAGGGLLSVGLPRRAELARAPVPYGVAIAGGGLYALWGLAAPLL